MSRQWYDDGKSIIDIDAALRWAADEIERMDADYDNLARKNELLIQTIEAMGGDDEDGE